MFSMLSEQILGMCPRIYFLMDESVEMNRNGAEEKGFQNYSVLSFSSAHFVWCSKN